MMPDVIGYQVAGAVDSYGDVTFGTLKTYRARIIGEQKLITSFQGTEVTSNQTVYVAGVIVAQPTDQITLSTSLLNSSEDSAIHPVILGAKRIPDQSGTHHSTLYLG
jgi:hypothetical protein|tara:strand:- start:389 stop:709 length:321 start_codon:yes stop_codon:yes gene_type:complete